MIFFVDLKFNIFGLWASFSFDSNWVIEEIVKVKWIFFAREILKFM